MNQQDFEKHINSYMKIDIELRNIANKYADTFLGGGYIEGIEVDFDGVFGTVDVTGTSPSHCSCCPDDYIGFTFPLSYLFEDDWLEQEQERRDAEKRRKEEKKKREEEEKEKQRKEAEYKRYLKLKEKYDPIEIKNLELGDE